MLSDQEEAGCRHSDRACPEEQLLAEEMIFAGDADGCACVCEIPEMLSVPRGPRAQIPLSRISLVGFSYIPCRVESKKEKITKRCVLLLHQWSLHL